MRCSVSVFAGLRNNMRMRPPHTLRHSREGANPGHVSAWGAIGALIVRSLNSDRIFLKPRPLRRRDLGSRPRGNDGEYVVILSGINRAT